MNDKLRRKEKARAFAARWLAKAGNEKQETQTFWLELLRDVLDFHDNDALQFERKVDVVQSGFIDAYLPFSKVLIEQKSRGVSLIEKQKQSDGHKLNAYEQALRYAQGLELYEQPRFIITCNFDEFSIHDQNAKKAQPVRVLLANLGDDIEKLSILLPERDEIPREERLSIEAGRLIGELYQSLSPAYGDRLSEEERDRTLNVLCVRLSFCLYAEDSGIFEDRAFYNYLSSSTASRLHRDLKELFEVLNTPLDKRDPYLDESLSAFPYVNGGLFAKSEHIAPFSELALSILRDKMSNGFDWSGISPTIFGAIFESTLNKETQRKGGMHYTSIENIHRVIDPLFLADLYVRFEALCALPAGRKKTNLLRDFQQSLGEICIFDPACGSGNFLTESYLSLRRLENACLAHLMKGQGVLGHDFSPIRVSIAQFYGIEINDFAVKVAYTALWIAEHQMLLETQKIVNNDLDFLPLKSYHNIVEGNALKLNWQAEPFKTALEESAHHGSFYIIGNPPFVGHSMQNREQKADMLDIFVDENGKRYPRAGKIDYVSGWFFKAAELIRAYPHCACAFVATNSITQGEQVADIWQPIIERFNMRLAFAWRTFKWTSEALDTAAVHCVIIAFKAAEKLKSAFICGPPPPRVLKRA